MSKTIQTLVTIGDDGHPLVLSDGSMNVGTKKVIDALKEYRHTKAVLVYEPLVDEDEIADLEDSEEGTPTKRDGRAPRAGTLPAAILDTLRGTGAWLTIKNIVARCPAGASFTATEQTVAVTLSKLRGRGLVEKRKAVGHRNEWHAVLEFSL